MTELRRLALHDLHVELGARLVPFAGYEMPVQYPMGVLQEHLHTRTKAGLFDVSHMGQIILRPKGDMADLVAGLEALMPNDVASLTEGRQRYGLFTNDQGGVLDDFMFANRGDHYLLVVNAGCKDADLALLQQGLAAVAAVTMLTDRALFALQGPLAAAVFARLEPGVAGLRFMDSVILASDYGELWVSRSGYTGEDGFEISVPVAGAERLARDLLAAEEVAPIGLGARDSLRLEAGLCLYGHELGPDISPVEAGLNWAIQKPRRRDGARAGGFPGAGRILNELADGPTRLRAGLRPEGRAPMREGTPLFATAEGGAPIGTVTSGGFGPSIGAPIAMGYLPPGTTGTVWGEVRGKRLAATVVAMPFHTTSYKR